MKGDTVVEALDEGCVCCSLADSLRPGLERIIAAMPAEQFVLETTGLANPANVMEALNGLRDLVAPGLVITVADALDLRGDTGLSPGAPARKMRAYGAHKSGKLTSLSSTKATWSLLPNWKR